MMDYYSGDTSNASEEPSFSTRDEIEELSKLKMEAFHLRLRCFNLEEELSNCKCSKEQDESGKEYFDNRAQLNNVVQSHQQLKWTNEQLKEENLLLQKKSRIVDELQNQLKDYESLKMKCEALSSIVNQEKDACDELEKMMNENETLIKDNVASKMRIMQLEQKMADLNVSRNDEMSLRRKSLTKSLSKIFNTSIQNTSAQFKEQCAHCDELKVSTDKLMESVIKMTIDNTSLTDENSQKNAQISNLEQEVLQLKILVQSIDKEELMKFKVAVKKVTRRFIQERQSKEELTKSFDELIAFYIKQQGEQQKEIESLRKERDNLKNDQSDKLGKIFIDKLSEVKEVQATSAMKISHILHGNNSDYYQIGQYSPQYRIRTENLGNVSSMSNADSFYDKNISLNSTMFKSGPNDESMPYEARVNEVLGNMEQKIRELGEVVQSYFIKIKDENVVRASSMINKSVLAMPDESLISPNTSVWSNMTENNESQISIQDANNLKMMYEEEMEQFDKLINEKNLKLKEMTEEIELLQQSKKESDASHAATIDRMSEQYTSNIAKYHQKVKTLRDEIENAEKYRQDQSSEILKLETANQEFEDLVKELRDEIENIEKEKQEQSSEILKLESLNQDLKDKYNQKIKELRMEIEEIEQHEQEQNSEIFQLKLANQQLEDKHQQNFEGLNAKIKQLEQEKHILCQDNYDAKDLILGTADNYESKLDEMEIIFKKVKSMIQDHPELFTTDCIDDNADSTKIKSFLEMLDSMELCLRENNNAVEKESINLSAQKWSVFAEESDLVQCLERSSNALKYDENKFYTNSLRLREPDCVSTVSKRSDSHFLDLTNVTELAEELPKATSAEKEDIEDKFLSIAEKEDIEDKFLSIAEKEGTKDKFKFIRENPEKIHKKMKYFYDTCIYLKGIAKKENEENKRLRDLSKSLCRAIDDMTKKIDEFKTQLDLCKQCLVRSQASLPDELAKQLRDLNVL